MKKVILCAAILASSLTAGAAFAHENGCEELGMSVVQLATAQEFYVKCPDGVLYPAQVVGNTVEIAGRGAFGGVRCALSAPIHVLGFIGDILTGGH